MARYTDKWPSDGGGVKCAKIGGTRVICAISLFTNECKFWGVRLTLDGEEKAVVSTGEVALGPALKRLEANGPSWLSFALSGASTSHLLLEIHSAVRSRAWKEDKYVQFEVVVDTKKADPYGPRLGVELDPETKMCVVRTRNPVTTLTPRATVRLYETLSTLVTETPELDEIRQENRAKRLCRL